MFWCCVNLPRWGLKRFIRHKQKYQPKSVNLPRWGLKLGLFEKFYRDFECKFTPLGFETPDVARVEPDGMIV